LNITNPTFQTSISTFCRLKGLLFISDFAKNACIDMVFSIDLLRLIEGIGLRRKCKKYLIEEINLALFYP